MVNAFALSCAGSSGAMSEPSVYLSWLDEIDLRRVVCEPGRETYRAIICEFHLAMSAESFRLDVQRDGLAAMTVKETETVINYNDRPRLVTDRARLLTPDELTSFR